MTDDLRTRIAAVLTGYVDHSHRYDLADAVIRELGLQRENDDEIPPFWPTQGEYRYVTEWTADD